MAKDDLDKFLDNVNSLIKTYKQEVQNNLELKISSRGMKMKDLVKKPELKKQLELETIKNLKPEFINSLNRMAENAFSQIFLKYK